MHTRCQGKWTLPRPCPSPGSLDLRAPTHSSFMCLPGAASETCPAGKQCWAACCSHHLANQAWLGCLGTQAELARGCPMQGEFPASNPVVRHKRHPYWSAMAKIIAALPGYALLTEEPSEVCRTLLRLDGRHHCRCAWELGHCTWLGCP